MLVQLSSSPVCLQGAVMELFDVWKVSKDRQVHGFVMSTLQVCADLLSRRQDAQSPDMRIDQRQVERRQIQIAIRDRQKHRPIDRWIPNIHLIRRLIAKALVRARDLDRCICQIELRYPCQKLRAGSGRRGYVAVVRAHSPAWVFPLKENLAAGEGQGFASIARNTW